MSKLASHDTMSYLKPKYWWMTPFSFIARCQKLTLVEQYEKGVRLFDIRIKFDLKNRCWDFAHGAMRYKGDSVDKVLNFLNSLGECIYIRLVLEYNRTASCHDYVCKQFVYDAKQWIAKYKNLTFFEFTRKSDWKRLLPNPENAPSIYQATSSTTWKIWDDWFPYIYAKTHNKDHIRQGTDKDFLMIDFIGCFDR